MIRIFYQFKVKSGEGKAFVDAWGVVNNIICSRCVGAHGSVLLRQQDERDTYVGVTKWADLDSWQKMRQSDIPSLDEAEEMMQHTESMSLRIMHEALSAEI